MPPSPDEIAERARKEQRRLQQVARRQAARGAMKVLAEAPPWLKRFEEQVAQNGEVPEDLIVTKCVVCGYPAVPGGNRCGRHPGSAKTVKKNANRRMRALVEESINELAEAMRQDKHLPTKITAIKAILERAEDNAIGPTKTVAEKVDTRPIIKIGIALGGVPGAMFGKPQGELAAPAIDATVVEVDPDGSDDPSA